MGAITPITEEILITIPPPFFSKCGQNIWEQRKVPLSITSTDKFQSLSLRVSKSPEGPTDPLTLGSMAALLINTFIFGWSKITFLIASLSRTFKRIGVALPEYFRINPMACFLSQV